MLRLVLVFILLIVCLSSGFASPFQRQSQLLRAGEVEALGHCIRKLA